MSVTTIMNNSNEKSKCCKECKCDCRYCEGHIAECNNEDCICHKPSVEVSTSKELIKQITNRFLGWKLPEDFHPDAGISFKKDFNENTAYPMKHEPIGTNLFDAIQAEEMVRYILGDTLNNCTCSGLSCDCPIHATDKVVEPQSIPLDRDEREYRCNHCKDKGYYIIPVSSPIMAPYGKDNTTSVPCECKINGTWLSPNLTPESTENHCEKCGTIINANIKLCNHCYSLPLSTEMEEWGNTIFHLKKAHQLSGVNCYKHPQGAPNCKDCGSTRYIKTSIGEALRLLKDYDSHSQKLKEEIREKCLKQILCTQDIDGGVCDCCEMNYNRIDEIKL